MLTQNQIQNIHKLDKTTVLEIMHECAEVLACVDMKQYCEIMNMNRRTVYDHIDKGKIKTFEIGDHKFPLINYK